MIDPQNPHAVVDALGQAPLDALGAAVAATRTDLGRYRRTLPDLAARHTQRGLLNWIHDQFFAHARNLFEAGVPEASVLDREPVRDLFVGHTFRIRLKKHTDRDQVTSYPTDGFLAFAQQDQPQLIQEIRLIGGYHWDPETREIGAAVLSARDGAHGLLWVRELVEVAVEDRTVRFDLGMPEVALPELPKIIETVAIERSERA